MDFYTISYILLYAKSTSPRKCEVHTSDQLDCLNIRVTGTHWEVAMGHAFLVYINKHIGKCTNEQVVHDGIFSRGQIQPVGTCCIKSVSIVITGNRKKLEQWRKEKVLNRCIKWVGIYLLQCLYIPSLIGSEWFTLAGWP